MTSTEDEQIRAAVLQLLEEYGNSGQIDFKNLPLLQDIVQKQVDQHLALSTQNRIQTLNKLYTQELKKNIKRNQAITKQELENLQSKQVQLEKNITSLKKQQETLKQKLTLDQRMARWTPIILIFVVIALILTTLGLLYLTLPIILHGTGFAGIWHFAHPTFHNWGIVRGVLAILGCFLLLLLELSIVLFPTAFVLRFIEKAYPRKVRKIKSYYY